MAKFFISDTHFSHANILKLSNRPFGSVEEMNQEIIRRWNAVVSDDDEVFHLGDVALGPIVDSLPLVSLLKGRKRLITGNHDRPFPPMQRGREEKIAEWRGKYKDAGFLSIKSSSATIIGDHEVFLSHFPYDGDSHDEERFTDYRLPDVGAILIHGHTHSDKVVTRSKAGSLQIHVGVDAWDFTPVSEDSILDIIEENI